MTLDLIEAILAGQAKDELGNTKLHSYAENNEGQVIRTLLTRVRTTDQLRDLLTIQNHKKETALHVAVLQYSIDAIEAILVRLFLLRDTNLLKDVLNMTNKDGYSVLRYMALSLPLFEKLVELAKTFGMLNTILLLEDAEGRTVLDLASYDESSDVVNMIRNFIEAIVNISMIGDANTSMPLEQFVREAGANEIAKIINRYARGIGNESNPQPQLGKPADNLASTAAATVDGIRYAPNKPVQIILTAIAGAGFVAASIVAPSKVMKLWMGVGLSAVGGEVVTAMLDDKMPASYSIPKTFFGIPRPHALGLTLAVGTIGSLLPTFTALAGASALLLKLVDSAFVPAIPNSLSNNGRAKEIQDKVNEACKALPYWHSMLGWYYTDKAIIGPAYQRVLIESAKHYFKIYGSYHSEGQSIPKEEAFAACEERNYIKALFQEENSYPAQVDIYVRQLRKHAGNPTCEQLFSAKEGDVEELAYDVLKSSTEERYGRKVTDIHKAIGTWESMKKDDNLKLIYPEYILRLLEHHNSTAIATDHGLPQVITERISKNICAFKDGMQAYLPEIIADNWLEDAFNKPHCAGDVPNNTASQVAM